ncbi:hypothetical protein [Paenibacillus alba]|uniref:Uncharacterized protein n=1 Tax=Paenibacillus alba TaxID=1197127 RepID=A0ABU6FZT4_9BACL|nr:hypothetical protein [Paenibacillus alba]MEC0226059.1 hypothetical protein [Paenibacillus alba]
MHNRRNLMIWASSRLKKMHNRRNLAIWVGGGDVIGYVIKVGPFPVETKYILNGNVTL